MLYFVYLFSRKCFDLKLLAAGWLNCYKLLKMATFFKDTFDMESRTFMHTSGCSTL